MYTLLVCADMYGEKINLEITFPAMPTISELQRKIADIFNAEAAVKRPQGYPNIEFSVARLQIYDDVLLKWADLVTCTQLHEYDQLYAFQPQSPWHIDVQKDLPPPRPPTAQAGGLGGGGGHSTYPQHASQPPHSGTPMDYNSASRGFASPGHGGAGPGTPGYYPSQHSPVPAAASSSQQRQRGSGRSPTQERLEQQRMREEQLRQELARVHEETMRIEQQAQQEAEEERRRAGEERERLLRQKEAEIARQREALRQAEEELQRARMAEESQQYSGSTARTLYR